MAIKKVNGENSRMVDKNETLARDLAMEITVGGDRFDRDDLFFFLSEAGASKDDILLLRNQTLELAKDMQPDGHEPDTIAFFNKELDFWLDTKAFEEYKKVGLSKEDLEKYSKMLAQRIAFGESSENFKSRDEFLQSIVSMGAVEYDLYRLSVATREELSYLMDSYEVGEISPNLMFKEVGRWLDESAFKKTFKELITDTGVDLKALDARPLPGMKDNKAAKKEAVKPKKVVPQIKR